MDVRAPLLVYGAGRSGSTVLCAMLNRHPRLSFGSEAQFVAPRVWQTFFDRDKDVIQRREDHSGFMRWHAYWRRRESGRELADVLDGERERINALIARLVFDAMHLDDTKDAWGCKELWNGGDFLESFDWAIYDEVFPRATWLHVVRNPFTFAHSSVGLDGADLTWDVMLAKLWTWVCIQIYSVQRARTGRYLVLRYEDLVQDPAAALAPALAAIGLSWDEACREAMSQRFVPSKRNQSDAYRAVYQSAPIALPGLFEMAERFGYLDDIRAMGIDLVDADTEPALACR